VSPIALTGNQFRETGTTGLDGLLTRAAAASSATAPGRRSVPPLVKFFPRWARPGCARSTSTGPDIVTIRTREGIQLSLRIRRHVIRAFVGLTVGITGVPALMSPASAAVINDPPALPHSIIAFPVRDFVSASGYAPDDRPIVQVLRGGVVIGTSDAVTPADDPKTPGFEGLVEVNHPGGGCWQGVTPDLRAGDVVRVMTTPDTGDSTPVANVTVTQPARQTAPGTVVMKGTAVSPTGGQIPADQLEARIVANKQAFVLNGKRTLRADAVGGSDGTLSYDSPTSTNWTATWTGLTGVSSVDGKSDAQRATDSTLAQSRGMWLGRVPGTTAEGTIFEFGEVGGPAAPCTAPLATGPTTPDMTAATDSGAASTDDITNVAAPTFTGLAGQAPAGSVMNLYVDGTVNGTGTAGAGGSYSLTPATPLTDGSHLIKVSETDPVSGVETLSGAGLTINVDTAVPVAPTVSAVTPASPGSSTTPALSGTAEAGTTVKLFTDASCTTGTGSGGSAAAFNGAAGVPANVADGSTTTFNANATDVAGNVSACSTTAVTYVQDSTPPPAPVIDTAPTSPTKDNRPSFSFSDTEADVTFACSMTTGADDFTPCTSPSSYLTLPDGSYTFKVRARDAAGNSSVTTRALTIDTAAPIVTLTNPPTSPSNDTTPTFTFSAKPGSTFSCSMTPSGGADSFSPCTSPTTFPALADGNYTFKVGATDPAGNVGPVATSQLAIDTVAPGASITGTPPNPTADNTPSFDFASADTTAKFTCSLTLASATLDNFQPCASGVTYPARANGNWIFKVKATDAAGNTGTADSYAFAINTVAPAAAVTLTPTNLTFPSTAVGAASAIRTVTLSNTGNAALSITNIGIAGANGGDFTQTHPTCGASLAAGSSCTIDVTFKPTLGGTRTGSLNVADSATGSPHTVALTGTATAAPADTTAPTVTTRTPANGATGVAIGTATTRTAVLATFSEAVIGVTKTTFVLKQGANLVPAAVTYNATTHVATLTPSAALLRDKTYTVTLTSGIKDAAGNALAPTPWSFITGPRPTITTRAPGVGAVAVPRARNVTATLSENVTGVNGTTFTLKKGATAIRATVTYNATSHVATLNPTLTLAASTTYTVRMTSGIKDPAGNPLTATSWTFTTGR
jgi:Bacterial Ig-like domain/Abnormal spindle-like microcephaly-assoc'd, ASPM-SPD-2-Hydin